MARVLRIEENAGRDRGTGKINNKMGGGSNDLRRLQNRSRWEVREGECMFVCSCAQVCCLWAPAHVCV